MKWFSLSWWLYLFDGCTGWTNFWCRVRNHPGGVVWYNVNALEPDMRCNNCGEDLG